MRLKTRSFFRLTAGDLMTTDVVEVSEQMAVRDAICLLARHQIGGAPVVDDDGRCVGAISSSDFLRLALKHGADVVASHPRPLACPYQDRTPGPDGTEQVACLLAADWCAYQRAQTSPDGRAVRACGQPASVCADWQILQLDRLPAAAVRDVMSANPVTVSPQTPLRTMARMMIDAHIHRLIVVDRDRRPVGVIAGTDIFAALAYAEDG